MRPFVKIEPVRVLYHVDIAGQGGRERDDDGTYWAVGVGGRYAIQSKTGVDLRLNLVTTSENEQSVYLALNQAF